MYKTLLCSFTNILDFCSQSSTPMATLKQQNSKNGEMKVIIKAPSLMKMPPPKMYLHHVIMK